MSHPSQRPLTKIFVHVGTVGEVVEMTVLGADSQCSACQAPIIWVETPRGKRMPVDRDQLPDGYRVSHFSTCPAAPLYRRQRASHARRLRQATS